MASLPLENPASTKPSANPELLTPQEYAVVAKVSLSWLAKARKRGDGPAYIKFGRSVRYYPPRMPE